MPPKVPSSLGDSVILWTVSLGNMLSKPCFRNMALRMVMPAQDWQYVKCLRWDEIFICNIQTMLKWAGFWWQCCTSVKESPLHYLLWVHSACVHCSTPLQYVFVKHSPSNVPLGIDWTHTNVISSVTLWIYLSSSLQQSLQGATEMARKFS